MAIIRAPFRPYPTALIEVMPPEVDARTILDAVDMLIYARKVANRLADLVCEHAAGRAEGRYP